MIILKVFIVLIFQTLQYCHYGTIDYKNYTNFLNEQINSQIINDRGNVQDGNELNLFLKTCAAVLD